MTHLEAVDAWWALVVRHLPLRTTARVFASVDAAAMLRADNYIVFPDPSLRGLEMRLERACRP